MDLSDIAIVDFHMHHFENLGIRDRIRLRANDYVRYLRVNDSKSNNTWVEDRVLEDTTSPYYQSLIQYISKTYKVDPTLADVDTWLQNNYDKMGLTEYIRDILRRENISLIQCAAFNHDNAELPPERSAWAFWVDDLLNLLWTNSTSDVESFDQLLDRVSFILANAVRNGCASLKNSLGYNRSLDIAPVSYEAGRVAFQRIWSTRPFVGDENSPDSKVPVFSNDEDKRSFKTVQDYLIKQLMIQCGNQGLAFQFHTGGGLAPTDIRNCNPLLLYPIFYDREILEARTKSVLLHAGMPFLFEAVTAANSFPQVYLDLSWPVRTNIMKTILRTVLSQVSHLKVLYGSDSIGVPDRLGLAASTFRTQLSSILDEMMEEGFEKEFCMQIAESVLNRNAKRIMKAK